MDLMEAIKKRRSIRKFQDTPVPKEDLKEMVEAAVEAPSAHNKQNWKFTVVTNNEINDKCSEAVVNKIDRIVEEYNITESVSGWKSFSSFFNKAPAVIYVSHKKLRGFLEKTAGEKGMSEDEVERLRVHPDVQSVAGAIQNLLLAATNKGYGTCWMTAPNVAAPEIENILGIEDPWQIAAIIPVGVPEKEGKVPPKKDFNEVFEIME